jgi:hypothetical protein
MLINDRSIRIRLGRNTANPHTLLHLNRKRHGETMRRSSPEARAHSEDHGRFADVGAATAPTLPTYAGRLYAANAT